MLWKCWCHVLVVPLLFVSLVGESAALNHHDAVSLVSSLPLATTLTLTAAMLENALLASKCALYLFPASTCVALSVIHYQCLSIQ